MPPMGPSDPASMPTPDAGLAAGASSQVVEGIKLLEMALPSFPVGSDQQKAVLDAVKGLSKVFPPSAAVPGVQMTQLDTLRQKAQQSQMLQGLTKAMGSGENVPPVQ